MGQSFRKNLSNPAVWSALVVALGMGGPTACVSTTAPKQDVLETSSAKAPAWVVLAPARWHKPAQAGAGFRFIFARDRLGDVAGGMKDTQLGAMDASLAAYVAAGREATTELAGADAAKAATVELERALEEAGREAHGRLARVSDVYYETSAADANGRLRYRAWVMVEMPTGAVSQLLEGLERRLARSRDPKARRVGDSLKRAGAKGVPELAR